MITAVLEHRGNTLVVELPRRLYELQKDLSSIGITWQASSLPVSGTGNIRVKLEAKEPVGEMVLSRMECVDLFLELNRVCQEIQIICPFGYDEFLDMLSPKSDPACDRYLFYRTYESVLPSTATGLRYLEEETERYRTTMENYQHACRIEEEGEAGETGEEWEEERGRPISLLVYKQRFQNPNYKSTASKNYAHVRYIATRPRVAKNEGMNHGLFGCLKPGTSLTEFQDWKNVARLVYQNSRRHVTMYRSVVSLGEDTAKELLLTDKKAWERYIENHIRTIAEKNGIRREHFQWAAALHREKSHPHLHVVFWDDSDEKAKIKNPFTHPSVPNNIRRQMIKDTFADRIRAYGEEKTKAAADLRKISDSLVDDFERHIRLLGNKRYQKLREEYDLNAELAEDFDFSDHTLNETADRVFRLKSALPTKGRIAYQLLSEELKKQVDALTAYLLSNVPELKKLRTDYVESKMEMVHLYGGSEEYLSSQRKKFEAEADKIIANRILGMVKTLNRLDDEGRAAEYREGRKKYYVEQMVLEMLDMLFSLVDTNCRQYDDFEKAWQGELSKEARKELYLKYQDKGYEH